MDSDNSEPQPDLAESLICPTCRKGPFFSLAGLKGHMARAAEHNGNPPLSPNTVTKQRKKYLTNSRSVPRRDGSTPNPRSGTADERFLNRVEGDWLEWLTLMFGRYTQANFGPHHIKFWEWVWGVEKHKRPRPWTGIWPRGHGKSSSAEMAAIALGARRKRSYFLYCCDSQDRADQHVQSIADMLESDEMSSWYPDMADRAVGKFGTWKGWRRNRLHTRQGFIIDALGLDVAARGLKIGNMRPDGLIFDDIDEDIDTTETTNRKIAALTRRILPATTNDAVVIAIQNLIHHDSIFSQLADGRAEFLSDRIVSGPIPAIENLTYETRVDEDGRPRTIITGGKATWDGLDLTACQNEITKEGITVFLSELQHITPEETGGMFDSVAFRHCTPDTVPQLDKVVCWVDPAVTDNDESDAMGIQIDGIARDGLLYRLWSWEKRSSPLEAIRLAIIKAHEYGSGYVGIETDQGGDTWRSVFREARDELGPEYHHLTMRAVKAGSGYGGKVHRASQMLSDYERGLIVHVEGTHHVLESALIRFPRSKPLDLCDAAQWSWRDLRRLSRPAKLSSATGTRLPDQAAASGSGRASSNTRLAGRRPQLRVVDPSRSPRL